MPTTRTDDRKAVSGRIARTTMERRGRITDTQTPRMVASMRFDCLDLLDQTLVLPATLLVPRGLVLSLFALGR